MTNFTTNNLKIIAGETQDAINEKYGIDDGLEYIDLNTNDYNKKKSHKVTIRNNKKRIGEANIYLHNVNKIMIVTGIIGIVVVSFTAGRLSKETKSVNYVYNVLSENYFKEPTYNGIKYTVKSGENVWSIVKKYENDERKIATLVKDVLSVNKINAKTLQSGDEILLVGVPSSKLYLFDYTDNYNLLDPIVEVDARINFLNKVKDKLINVPSATTYLANIENVLTSWNSYKYSYVLGEESDEFNIILTELREMCEAASEYGYDYDFNKKAYPLSVVPDNQKNESRAY